MLFRPVRAYLDEAMAEVQSFTTLSELKELLPDYATGGKIAFRDQGIDERIGWHSFLVSVDGVACGHTNGIPKRDE